MSCPLTGKGSFSQMLPHLPDPHDNIPSPSPPSNPTYWFQHIIFFLPAFQVDPQVWNTPNPSVANHHSPITDPTGYRCIPHAQGPLSLQSLSGLKPILSDLLRKKNHFVPHTLPSTPQYLQLKKPNGTFCLVQDLWLINFAVVLLCPVVPNPTRSFPLSPRGPRTSQFWISKMLSSLSLSAPSPKAFSTFT